MSNPKPILFYSTYCQYSTEIITILQKKNLIDKFININISNSNYKIPSIIKQVPTILYQNKIYIDKELEQFINNITETNENKNIEAFFPSEMNSGIGSAYSYLEEPEEKVIKNSLMFIDDNFSISTPNEDDFKYDKNTVNLNKYQEQRDNDIKDILK